MQFHDSMFSFGLDKPKFKRFTVALICVDTCMKNMVAP